jgi:hypothetical protein
MSTRKPRRLHEGDVLSLLQQGLQGLGEFGFQRGHAADGHAGHQPRMGVQRVADVGLERIQPAEAVVRVRAVPLDAPQASLMHDRANPVARVVFGQVGLRDDRRQRARPLKRLHQAAHRFGRGDDVAVSHQERLVANQRQRAQHPIRRARRRVLADEGDGRLEIVQRGAHRRLMHADDHNQPLDARLSQRVCQSAHIRAVHDGRRRLVARLVVGPKARPVPCAQDDRGLHRLQMFNARAATPANPHCQILSHAKYCANLPPT